VPSWLKYRLGYFHDFPLNPETSSAVLTLRFTRGSGACAFRNGRPCREGAVIRQPLRAQRLPACSPGLSGRHADVGARLGRLRGTSGFQRSAIGYVFRRARDHIIRRLGPKAVLLNCLFSLSSFESSFLISSSERQTPYRHRKASSDRRAASVRVQLCALGTWRLSVASHSSSASPYSYVVADDRAAGLFAH